MTTQIKAGVIAANAVNSSELASGALSGQNFTGDVTFDTTTLVIDSTNNRVGIGTSSPDANLEVITTESMSFASDTVNSITLGTSGTNKPCIKFDTADTTHTNRVWAIESGAGERLNFFRNGLDVLKLNQDGSVEIPGSIINSSAGATVATFEGNYSASGDVKLASFERIGGAVAAAIEYNDATTDMEFGTTTSHALSFITGDTRRVTIDSSGNVGIGTTNPDADLHVKGAGATNIRLEQGNGSNYGQIKQNQSLQALQLGVGGDFAMTINSSGNVGIGITNPSSYVDDNNSLVVAGQVRIEGVTNSAGSPLLALADNNSGLYLPSANVIAISTAGVEKMRFDGNKVYFGNQSNVASSGYIEKLTSGDYSFNIYASSSTTTNRAITFHNRSNTEAMRIDSSGNLLINTLSAFDNGTSKLQVTGSPSGGRSPATFQSTGDDAPSISCWKTNTTTSSSARFIQFYADTSSTPMGGIVGNGASNAQFATLSDEREKENITPVDNVLNKLMNLNVVSFDWKKHDDHVEAGFIAQNVEKHFPEYVIENIANDGEEARKGTTGGMSAGYIAVLTKAIQEQQTIIDDLKSRLDEAGL